MNRGRHEAVIAVASHALRRVPKDPPYLPIYVGSSLRPEEAGRAAAAGFVRDDSGDNISGKNWGYSELTGLYWVWKNRDADWKGIVHYRRYFKGSDGKILKMDELEGLMDSHRILVPSKRRYYIETLESHYEHTHDGAHLGKTGKLIARECPEYLGAYRMALGRTWGYMFNMVAMESRLLDRYCGWLFPLLSGLESEIDIKGMSPYEARLFGRVSEVLFNAWLLYMVCTGEVKEEDIKEVPLLFTGKTDWLRKTAAFLKAKFFHIHYSRGF